MVFTLIQDASKILSNGTHLAWTSDDQAYVEEQFILYTTEDDTMPMFERMSLPLGVVTYSDISRSPVWRALFVSNRANVWFHGCPFKYYKNNTQ